MKDKIEQIIDRFRSAFDSEIQIYSMADYIFELETKLQNTSSNSDYAKPCEGCNQTPTVKCLKSRLETGNC